MQVTFLARLVFVTFKVFDKRMKFEKKVIIVAVVLVMMMKTIIVLLSWGFFMAMWLGIFGRMDFPLPILSRHPKDSLVPFYLEKPKNMVFLFVFVSNHFSVCTLLILVFRFIFDRW